MDYIAACCCVWVQALASALHVSRGRCPPGAAALLTAGVALLLARYVHYMMWVKFDYGWQVVFGGSGLALTLACWLAWAACAPEARARPRLRLLASLLAVAAAASLELLDFEPLLDLLDAHALWHLATVLPAYLFWSFLAEDARIRVRSIAFGLHRD
jgi:hypothetical protein